MLGTYCQIDNHQNVAGMAIVLQYKVYFWLAFAAHTVAGEHTEQSTTRTHALVLKVMRDFLDFLDASPSSFHAAREVAKLLPGFRQHDETEELEANPGGHYIIRGGAIVAWWVPTGTPNAFRIVGSHTDSPGFMLKPVPEVRLAGWQQAQVEVYGGPILASWFDRELEFAGRIVTFDGEEKLVRTPPAFRIPHLAIHLTRDNNLTLDKQQHMQPIFAAFEGAESIADLIAQHAEVDPNEIAAWDLITRDTQPARTFGVEDACIAAGRLDNLSSVYASAKAFAEATQHAHDHNEILVLACFDHEEIGSNTASGAAGPLLQDVLTRIAHACGADTETLLRMYARSTCVSADAAHAVHPNYMAKYDPASVAHLNAGPVLKINANQRYATNASTSAMWLRACRAADVPYQKFVSRNDVPCGSTIGPITATRLGISTVDVGIPLLSMHSARELAGVRDMEWFTRALYEYFVG